MFFKGRPLKDEQSISDYKLTNDDVILYMIAEQPKSEDENEISQLSQNIENVDILN
jgi:hypothetical protein